jgi:hypothetical protein
MRRMGTVRTAGRLAQRLTRLEQQQAATRAMRCVVVRVPWGQVWDGDLSGDEPGTCVVVVSEKAPSAEAWAQQCRAQFPAGG